MSTTHGRKANPARLLARRPDGIFVAPFELGEIGPDLFHAACQMGLEGLVSKRQDRPYWAGRSKHRIKFKNRKHSPMSRVMETKWWAAQKKSPSQRCAPLNPGAGAGPILPADHAHLRLLPAGRTSGMSEKARRHAPESLYAVGRMRSLNDSEARLRHAAT